MPKITLFLLALAFQGTVYGEHAGASKAERLRPLATGPSTVDVTHHVKSTASCAIAAMLLATAAHGVVTLASAHSATVALESGPLLLESNIFEMYAYEYAKDQIGSVVLAGTLELSGASSAAMLQGAFNPLRLVGLPGFVEGCKGMYRNVVTSFQELGATLKAGREQRASMTRQCAAGPSGFRQIPLCLRRCGVTGPSREWPKVLQSYFQGDPSFESAPLSTNVSLVSAAMSDLHSVVFNMCYQEVCERRPWISGYRSLGSCRNTLRSQWANIRSAGRSMPPVPFTGWVQSWRERARLISTP